MMIKVMRLFIGGEGESWGEIPEGNGKIPEGRGGRPDRSLVLADRARSECARSMRAVGDQSGHPLLYGNTSKLGGSIGRAIGSQVSATRS
jgi:hypothetical protein